MGILKILLIGLCLPTLAIHAQRLIKLYPGGIPNSKEISLANIPENSSASMMRRGVTPTLQLFLPKKDKASGSAMVICPGGGYSVIVYNGEGVMTARDFVEKGVAAFVLQYRLPNNSFQVNKMIAPLQDTQQAIKLVGDSASVWGIDSKKVGIMGFSAGGHLAFTDAIHYGQELMDNQSHTNIRPDCQILVCPVISMQDNLTHVDSRRKLLGTEPPSEAIDLYSDELQVDKDTRPAYITQAAGDKVVDVDNSIVYFEKLRQVGVPVEMHIYQKGNHGFVFRHPGWMSPLFEWMELNGWIK